MLTTRSGVRVLAAADLDAFLELADQEPVVNVFAIHRARTTGLEPRWLGGEMWGRFEDGLLVAACHVAANLVPVQARAEDAVAFAARALARRRTASTIVGPQDAVRAFWDEVGGAWGRPREERWDQRHMVIEGPPVVAPDPAVRPTVREDLESLYPACVAMYTEEVGGVAGGRGRSRPLPHAGGPADQPRLVVRALRRRRAGLQGRGRLRHPPTPPRSRACGCRRTGAARAWPPPAWLRWCSW
ncbi:DUF4081 domain-containing protein [Nocardioides sp. TF02-7]|uniref:DUF4081 domain-containing protein n=1 Tax=Nocardioides sp. TF02-7 TaxID=2917724 RepID=UPI001F05FB98|nr:DUF4081 domain-containing protein [Nocardioides sp. TF02-7]UMG92016.1 DUF4081 domain-containing protein [Nocardioides sp. TF02-7]